VWFRLVSDDLDAMVAQLARIESLLRRLLVQEHLMAATITDVDAKIDDLDNDLTSLQGAAQSIATDLADRTQELLDAIAAGTDPAAVQAVADKLDATRQTVSDIAGAISQAQADNPDPTPDAPPVDQPPPTA